MNDSPDTNLSPAHPVSADIAVSASAGSASRYHVDSTLSYQLDAVCDFTFLIHATMGSDQRVLQEELTLDPPVPVHYFSDTHSGNRFTRLQAGPGPLTVRYRATVERIVTPFDVDAEETPIHDLPDNVLHHLMPTRYCESDHLGPAAQKIFRNAPRGARRVQAICDWIRQNVDYRVGSSDATTTARDVFVQRAGVCRDFAHLGVTFCRALNIPARLVCGYVRFEEPPPDFHAIFEAFVGGRWMQFDPTGMAPVEQVIRVATGRDAKDTAFATIYGPARMVAMSPEVELSPPGSDGAPVSPQPQAQQEAMAA